MQKFKPCPHCGEKENIFIEESEDAIGRKRVRRYCRYCGMSTGYCFSDKDAIDQWNTRFDDGITVDKENESYNGDGYFRFHKEWKESYSDFMNRVAIFVKIKMLNMANEIIKQLGNVEFE